VHLDATNFCGAIMPNGEPKVCATLTLPMALPTLPAEAPKPPEQ
jgi:hypothetical protein